MTTGDSGSMDYQYLLYEKQRSGVLITLNRPGGHERHFR